MLKNYFHKEHIHLVQMHVITQNILVHKMLPKYMSYMLKNLVNIINMKYHVIKRNILENIFRKHLLLNKYLILMDI